MTDPDGTHYKFGCDNEDWKHLYIDEPRNDPLLGLMYIFSRRGTFMQLEITFGLDSCSMLFNGPITGVYPSSFAKKLAYIEEHSPELAKIAKKITEGI